MTTTKSKTTAKSKATAKTKATQPSQASSAAPASKSPDRDSNGRFIKGHAWAGGGAIMGEKRRLSQEASLKLLRTFYDRLDSLPATLDKLEKEDPAKYATVLVAMAKFATPALQSQQLDITIDETSSIESLLLSRIKSKTE